MVLYETTIIIDSMLKPEDIQNLRERILSFIANNGGEIVKVEEWGKRRLAYEIKKKQYGFYLHVRFKSPPALIALLEKEYRLNESILRYLTVKVHRLALKQEERDRRMQQQPSTPVVETREKAPTPEAQNDTTPVAAEEENTPES